VEYVVRCQNPDGGFKYQPLAGGESAFPRSAAALVALFTSGVAEGPAIEGGLRYLQQFRPGEPTAQDRGYYFYGQYYAVRAPGTPATCLAERVSGSARRTPASATLRRPWTDPIIS
jgi:hypothetical protein